jgi:hypothetical protein
VTKSLSIRSRSLLCAAAGLVALSLLAAGGKPAAAQSSDAANLCTPDVMRLCSEFVPDADRIVGCLKAKRRQLSPQCSSALAGKSKASSGKSSGKSKKRRVRHHHRS